MHIGFEDELEDGGATTSQHLLDVGTRLDAFLALTLLPAMLHELMTRFDAAPDGSLMIGDTSHDLEMAAAAGVDAVAVCYGAHAAQDLRALRPRACLDSVAELEQWLHRHA